MSSKRIYETIFVLHPELSEEEAEANLQNTVTLLKTHGSEMIRTERVGKRRLAYIVQKQRYGYYNLMHYYGTPAALSEMERTFRLSDRVLRYLTVRFDKEDQLTGLTRMGDDDGRDEDRDDRRRGGRRGDPPYSRAPRERETARPVVEVDDTDREGTDEERAPAASATATDQNGEGEGVPAGGDVAEKASEESH
jgi:small subunit ribosomal protein S6